jgi:transcriptional regulator with XRE-family HTH domain
MDPILTQIERAMVARRVTPVELARRLGHRHVSAVSRLLSGRHEPDDTTLQRLADALETELVRPAVPAKRFEPSAPEA